MHGKNVNYYFRLGFTADEILEKLEGREKIDFENFLSNTKHGKLINTLTKEEIEAINFYTGKGYEIINPLCRGKEKVEDKYVKVIDSVISRAGKLEENMILYRALKMDAFSASFKDYDKLFRDIDPNDYYAMYATLKMFEGMDFHDKAYMSVSPGYSTSFAKMQNYPIVLEIMGDENISGVYINQLSEFYNKENELLLARNTSFRMVEVMEPSRDINGNTKIIIKCIVEK